MFYDFDPKMLEKILNKYKNFKERVKIAQPEYFCASIYAIASSICLGVIGNNVMNNELNDSSNLFYYSLFGISLITSAAFERNAILKHGDYLIARATINNNINSNYEEHFKELNYPKAMALLDEGIEDIDERKSNILKKEAKRIPKYILGATLLLLSYANIKEAINTKDIYERMYEFTRKDFTSEVSHRAAESVTIDVDFRRHPEKIGTYLGRYVGYKLAKNSVEK